ncbi:MFS transporter [Arthrobacter roseus]|uniref:MFS transporter n=1 Tax=Arthrobacter roseus TaxID=136274 RepID=UPI001964147A|nr:MFS transporter [Arthrobacter roseus]MBM7848472.1 MFS family permease [Arthrobacter roseus]
MQEIAIDPLRVQRRTVAVLASAQLFSGIGNGAGLAIGSIMAVDLSGSAVFAGASTTAISVAASVTALPLAAAAGRYGRRRALMAGVSLALLGALLMIGAAVVGSFALLLAGSALLGVGNAANLQSRFAALDLAEPQHRGRDLSIVVWSITVGAVAGPNLIKPGAQLGLQLGIPEIAGPFLFSAAGMGIALMLLWMGLRPDPLLTARAIAGDTSQQTKRSLSAGLRAIRASSQAKVGLVALVGAHLVMVAVMSMTPVHLSQLDAPDYSHHANSTDLLAFIGFTISLHIAGMFALSPLMGWMTDRLGRIPVILIGESLLLSAVAVAGLSSTTETSVTVGLILLGLGWSATTISGSTLLAESVEPANRVLVQGVSDTLMGAAGAAGAALSGLVLAGFGFRGLNLAAGLVTLMIVGYVLLTRRPKSNG